MLVFNLSRFHASEYALFNMCQPTLITVPYYLHSLVIVETTCSHQTVRSIRQTYPINTLECNILAHLNVAYLTIALFNSSLFDRADLWIGGDISWHPFSIVAEGSTDLYISVPSPDRVSLFCDCIHNQVLTTQTV